MFHCECNSNLSISIFGCVRDSNYVTHLSTTLIFHPHDLIIEQQCEVEVAKVHKLDQNINYNFFKLLLSNIKEVKSNI